MEVSRNYYAFNNILYSLFKSDLTKIYVWNRISQHPIIELQWCFLNLSNKGKQNITEYDTRLCEFFAIDEMEDFMIWNL